LKVEQVHEGLGGEGDGGGGVGEGKVSEGGDRVYRVNTARTSTSAANDRVRRF
jgi:hypothetical protein